MTPVPLAQLRLSPKHHLSALWWLGLLYRRPQQFVEAFKRLRRWQLLGKVIQLWAHSVPYLLLWAAFWHLVGGSALPTERLTGTQHLVLPTFGVVVGLVGGLVVGLAATVTVGLAKGMAVGTTFGLAFGIAGGISLALATGLAVGMAAGLFLGSLAGLSGGLVVGIFAGLIEGLAKGVAKGLDTGITTGLRRLYAVMSKRVSFALSFGLAFLLVVGTLGGVVFGLTYELGHGLAQGLAVGFLVGLATGSALRISLSIVKGMTGTIRRGIVSAIEFGTPFGVGGGYIAGAGLDLGFDVGIAGVLTLGSAFGLATTRAYYFPLHVFLVLSQRRARLYRYHPVAWDDLSGIRFPGLYQLLVAFATSAPDAGAEEIERLLDAYPTQRGEALKAKVIVVAREAGRLDTLAPLPKICAKLPEGERGFVAETPKLKAKIAEIAAIQARLDAMDRPFLRGPTAQLLVEKIETFRDQIAGFREPLASEFRTAAKRWLEIANEQEDRTRKVLDQEPTAQVFRAGDPVDREKEAFVPRIPIFEALEAQVMLATGCPGILLYGRRRMGKSTVLKNLPGFLPPSIRVVNVSMQNPEASGSHALFARHVAEAIHEAVSDGNGQETPGGLPSLYRFLNNLDSDLLKSNERLLLGVDEFENIDRKIKEGVFSTDLLDTLRESMQSHRQITWVFSGSHSIDELDGAEWASYLVSARTVEVPPFTREETRLLLTEPLKHSKLWDKDDPARPRFAPEMWGERGIERIFDETGGWPHLVQLVAETLVDRMNDAGKGQVDDELFEKGLDAAVTAGDTVLSQLVKGESRLSGEWEYLLGFRANEAQPPPEDDEVRRSLRRRLVVVEDDDGGDWRLRAPLFRRWLRKRG